MKIILAAAILALTITAAIFAQGPVRGRLGTPPEGYGQRGQRGDPAAALKAALDLTDAQVESIKALMQTRQERSQVIMTELRERRQALDTLLSAASPNPTDVGNAAIALRATENKLKAEQEWFLGQLRNLLTGTQQQTLDSLIAAGAPLPGILGPGGGFRGRGPRPQ